MSCPVNGFREIHQPATGSPATAASSPKGHRFLGFLPGRRDWVCGFGDALSDVGDVAYYTYVSTSASLVGHPDRSEGIDRQRTCSRCCWKPSHRECKSTMSCSATKPRRFCLEA